jgi:hypothetical protein
MREIFENSERTYTEPVIPGGPTMSYLLIAVAAETTDLQGKLLPSRGGGHCFYRDQ